MAKHAIKPRAILGNRGIQTRVLVNGRWLRLDRALALAGQIVAQDAKDAAKARVARLAAILG